MSENTSATAHWKVALVAAVVMLALAGLFVVLFNLPIVTGRVPA